MTNHTTIYDLPESAYLDVNDLCAAMEDLTGTPYTVSSTHCRYAALVPCATLPFTPVNEIRGHVFLISTNMYGTYVLDRKGTFNAYAHQRLADHISMMNEIEEIANGEADLSDYEGFEPVIRVPVATSRQADADQQLPETTAIVPMPVTGLTTATAPVTTVGLLTGPVISIERPIVTPITIVTEKGTMTKRGTVWVTPSNSEEGVEHITQEDGSSCSCKGHYYKGKCWHRTAAAKRYVDDRKRERDLAPPAPRRRRYRSKMWK